MHVLLVSTHIVKVTVFLISMNIIIIIIGIIILLSSLCAWVCAGIGEFAAACMGWPVRDLEHIAGG